MLYGALEAGGTKMVCAVGNAKNKIIDTITLPTKSPTATFPKMIDFYKNFPITALGIGSFGPIDLNKSSSTYGYITNTPKILWQNFPLLNSFEQALSIPIHIDTDVNAAVLAEVSLGAAKNIKNCLYVTIGTGIGGGLYIEGNLVHGLMHPEFGHMLISKHKDDPLEKGLCPFHDTCLESLASGSSLIARWETPSTLPSTHMAWDLESYYLAQMCMNAIVSFSPEKIILGGGVMAQKHLYKKIRTLTLKLLNDYILDMDKKIDTIIVPPGLNTQSGIIGALLLAQKA